MDIALVERGTSVFGRAKDELKRPPVSHENGAIEILRVWGGPSLPQQYSLRTVWDDPGAWGLLLADIARHAAKEYGAGGRITEVDALVRIKEVLDAEWGSPTDDPFQVK